MARYFGNTYREPIPHATPWAKSKDLNNPHPKKTGYELFDAVELLGVLYLGYQFFIVGLPWIFRNIWAGVGSIVKKGADVGAEFFGFKNAEAFVNWAQGKHNVKIQIFADELLMTLDGETLSRVPLPKENFTFKPTPGDQPSINMPFSSQYSYKGIEETETAVICYDLLLLLDYYASTWTWYGQATGRQKVEWILHTNLVCTENTNQLAYFSLWYYWEYCKQTFEKAGYRVNHKLYTDCNGTFHYLDTKQETFYISYKTIGR